MSIIQITPNNTTNDIDIDNLNFMGEYTENLINFNLKHFNYIIYEEDINNLYNDEFIEYLTTEFQTIIDEYNQYLHIDISPILSDLNKIERNKKIVKNIIKFIGMDLPYIILREILKKYDKDGMFEILSIIDTIDTRSKIIEELYKKIDEIQNLNNLLLNLTDNIKHKDKKEQFQNKLKNLNNDEKNKIENINYFISIINNSSEENIKELLKEYIKNDYDNIIL